MLDTLARFVVVSLFALTNLYALVREDMEFKVYQFPSDQIPRIDGKIDDWSMVPQNYIYGTELLKDTEDGHGSNIDHDDLDVSVVVGWVKNMNRLYFLYQAHDDFWDFGRFDPRGYLNDIFEIALDADLSGGPFIFNPQISDRIDNHFRFSGVHAQNYHIYTPPVNNAKVLVWGCQHWIADFPHANFAYDYSFQHGEAGDLILECWITPFDYAPYAGFNEARVSELQENQLIGLAWSILDFDGGKRDGHFNLAHDVRMVKNASYLCPFRLMPLEPVHLKHLQADWSFKVVNMQERKVAFIDESVGDITDWLWEFGDGQSSTERNPIHVYEEPGIYYVVTLTVKSENQISKRSRYWEVMIK